MLSPEDAKAIDHFKAYLRLPSAHPDVDYTGSLAFISGLACDAGLPWEVFEVAPGKPVLLVTWRGKDRSLPSVLLNSHMDVVTTQPEQWTHPPFSAYEDEEGNIYARGAQDMKCVSIQYLEAIHRLMMEDYRHKRTIHLSFTSDEEIGSLGMKMFVESEIFKNLNVGCELDEGSACPIESFVLFNGESTQYKVIITCKGPTGHGSRLLQKTAGEKLTYVIKKFDEKREIEKEKLQKLSPLQSGEVTIINLTMLEGGVQANILPPELKVTYDCRVSLNEDQTEFESWVADVCQQAGEDVTHEFVKSDRVEPTKLDDTNEWWLALKNRFDKMELKLETAIFPATTDARFLRGLGIPAFGFSPMNNTEILAHNVNEAISVKVFLKGIEIYKNLIHALAEV